MLACDGIWDCLSNEECMELLQAYLTDMGPLSSIDKKKLAEPVEKLLDDIIAPDTEEKIGTDNMTAILIYLQCN